MKLLTRFRNFFKPSPVLSENIEKKHHIIDQLIDYTISKKIKWMPDADPEIKDEKFKSSYSVTINNIKFYSTLNKRFVASKCYVGDRWCQTIVIDNSGELTIMFHEISNPSMDNLCSKIYRLRNLILDSKTEKENEEFSHIIEKINN